MILFIPFKVYYYHYYTLEGINYEDSVNTNTRSGTDNDLFQGIQGLY